MIERRADEIEAARRLPPDLVDELRKAGVFRMSMPSSWGGPEMTPRQQVEVVETLSTADPSVGWCVMIGSDGGYCSAFMDDRAGHELWPDLDAVTAGWLAPAGRARLDGNTYVVDGRWSFGSGCTHADVMIAGCLEFNGDNPVTLPDGRPLTRVVVAPAAAWTIHDTWFTTGLAGSGSHDYSVAGLRVPAEHTFTLHGPVLRQGPLYQFPGMFFATMSGVPLGLARRAIDTTIAIVQEKPLLPQRIPMREHPRIRLALAQAELMYGSARAYVYQVLDQVWQELDNTGTLSLSTRVQLSLSRAGAFRMAREVAQSMVDTIGARAIHHNSPLDRLLRDAITMRQHIVIQDQLLELVGSMILGNESPLPYV